MTFLNLTTTIIAEHLKISFDIQYINVSSDSREIHSMLLYNDGDVFQSNTAYIALAKELPDCPDPGIDSLIISIGHLAFEKDMNDINLIVVSENTNLALVANSVQSFISKNWMWYDKLNSILLHERGIQALLDLTLPLLENPIYLHDNNFRYLAFSENKNHPLMKESYTHLINGLKKGQLTTEYVCKLVKIRGFDKTFDEKGVGYWENEGDYEDEYNYIYRNLHIDNKFVGRIIVDERIRKFRALDYAILDELGITVEMALKRRNISPQNHMSIIGELFSKILDGESISNETLENQLSYIDFHINDKYICIQVDMDKKEIFYPEIVATSNLLEEKIRTAYTFVRNNNIICMVKVKDLKDCKQHIENQLAPLLLHFNYRAGISDMFSDLKQLPTYYQQTNIALKFSHLGLKKCVYIFNDYVFEYLLDLCTYEFDAELICPASLKKLLKYDKDNKTDFTSTLRVYLECDCSPSKAMEKLFIHRSTLLYRLSRIDELIGNDFLDVRKKIHFLLSFQILDKHKHQIAHTDTAE